MSYSPPRAHTHRRRPLPLSWIPITLHPRVLGLRNRFLQRKGISTSDLCALAMTAILMAGLFYGTSNTLHEMDSLSSHEAMRDSLLHGFSLGLFTLIFLSAAVTGISALFMAQDVDLLLSAPISETSLLCGKTLEVLISTSWMIIVFSIPPYIAFGQHLDASALFFCLAPVFVSLLLLVAVLLGMLVAIVCASMVPARTGRNIFIGLFVIALGLVLAIINASPETSLHANIFNHSTRASSLLLLHHPALPSTWLSDTLLSLAHFPSHISLLPITFLIVGTILLWTSLRISFRLFYHRAYSRLHSHPKAFSPFSGSRKGYRWFGFVKVGQSVRALATRELLSFGRDITHTVQLALFLTICILYFVNFRNVTPPTHVGTWVLRAWDLLSVMSFIMLSSLIILSICARFVFPSISLEGASLWILQVAPLNAHRILWAKYLTWALPLATIYTILFASAGLALALQPICIMALCLSACIMTHGLVALGIGLGARFCRFDWEHPAELATSWGSVLFLLTGILTLGINLLPLCLTFGCYLFFPLHFEQTSNAIVLFGAGLGTLLLINLIVGKIALRVGKTALSRVLVG